MERKEAFIIEMVTYLLDLKFSLLLQDRLVDIVILLADAPKCRTHLFVLLVAELPRRYDVVGLEEGVAGNETVLGTPVVISIVVTVTVVKFKFKSINFCVVLYFCNEKLRREEEEEKRTAAGKLTDTFSCAP